MSELKVLRFGLLVGRCDFALFYKNWRIWCVAWGVRSITAAAMIALLGQLLGSVELVHYLLVGNAVIVGVHAAGWAIQSSTWDRMDGTYPLLVVSPCGLRAPLTGRTAIWIFNGFMTSLTTFAALALLFQLPLPSPQIWFAPLCLVVICCSAYAFALSVGAFVVRVPRGRNITHSFALTILAAFTGANVPLAFWPSWVQLLANGLPVTHGLDALRTLLAQGDAYAIARGLGLETLIGAIWFGFAHLAMNAMANAGRADGTIDFVGV
jgi:ABC-2 type transport system permease protein